MGQLPLHSKGCWGSGREGALSPIADFRLPRFYGLEGFLLRLPSPCFWPATGQPDS